MHPGGLEPNGEAKKHNGHHESPTQSSDNMQLCDQIVYNGVDSCIWLFPPTPSARTLVAPTPLYTASSPTGACGSDEVSDLSFAGIYRSIASKSPVASSAFRVCEKGEGEFPKRYKKVRNGFTLMAILRIFPSSTMGNFT